MSFKTDSRDGKDCIGEEWQADANEARSVATHGAQAEHAIDLFADLRELAETIDGESQSA